MALGRLWAGRAYGTNVGNVFVRLRGDDCALSGTVHFNEPGVGVVVYAVTGQFDGTQISLSGNPSQYPPNVQVGALTAVASLDAQGNLHGEWETTIGLAGTFVLFPHDRPRDDDEGMRPPDQLHMARYDFTAIEINRDQIIRIAELMQDRFQVGRLVVTVEGQTAQSCFLPDFKRLHFSEQRAKIVKLHIQEPAGGINRAATLEFGPSMNFALTQGPDEAWVRGMLEQIKSYTRPHEQSYSTNIKRLGFSINQAMLLGTLVVLPSLKTLGDRAILVGVVVALMFFVVKVHERFLPFSAIYLQGKPLSPWSWVAPTALSWAITATAGTVAALAAAYLQGWIGLPFSGG